jgi:hypothetical protein
LRHHRVDQPESAALTRDRGVDAHGCQRGGPEQIDGEPRRLERGIAGVVFENMAENAADVVAADRAIVSIDGGVSPYGPRAMGCGTKVSPSATKNADGPMREAGASAARSCVVIAIDDIGLVSCARNSLKI